MALFPGTVHYQAKNVKDMKWCDHHNIISNLEYPGTKDKFQQAEETLKFPHRWLKLIYSKLLLHSRKPISEATRKSYHNSLSLYMKLKQSNNIEEWIECIKQIEDKEAAIANIELIFKKEIYKKNKKMWKLYFKLLTKIGSSQKKILDSYFEYTKLFINDKKAVERYRNEIEKFSIWNEMKSPYWIDTIKYEIKYGNIKFAYQLLKKAVTLFLDKEINFIVKDENDIQRKLKSFSDEMTRNECQNIRKIRKEKYEAMYSKKSSKSIIPYSDDFADYMIKRKENPELLIFPHNLVSRKEIPITTTFKNDPIKQNFSFRHSFIQHFLKSANAYILKKLYSSCKFFFSFLKAPLCYRLEILGIQYFNDKIIEETLYVSHFENTASNFSILNNFHVYGKLFCLIESNRKCLSMVLQKLYRCDVSRLCIISQDLTKNEYKFMLSKNIVQIRFNNVYVYNGKQQQMDAVELLKIAKQMPIFKFFEHINDKWFACFTNAPEYKCLPIMKTDFHEQLFENIYIVGQELSITKFRLLLNPWILKKVILINTIIKKSNNKIMKKDQLKKFISSKVQKQISIIVIENV